MRIENIMACFCKNREVQATYEKILNKEELTSNDRDFLIELIQYTSISANKIKEYCSDIYKEELK
ncbi:hypothetical protein [Lederbergia lenta]|uniref:Uncharacterized protein n=1 Tax=Lederbergia lenta TaxID=1467 RepID=A0A2X4WHS1_LEDLE|nr:hypothetical protein [Lederbergia lenta]MEC2323090.1 hypothetical protein [Lederbergia lenta]SQI62701.1 Uncharacterised protein [Lederbergia lenta]